MILLIRLLPFLIALLEGVLFFQQIRHPLQYPYLALLGVVALPLASIIMSFRRVRFFDLLEKMTPSFVLLASLGFGLLLAETTEAYAVIVVLGVLSTFISLELLFLHAYDPPRYPVNGLSRVNIAYVPIAVWFTAATSSGLLTFLHSDRIWHLVALIGISTVLFRTTGHPGATRKENAIWTGIGALVGLHVGLLGLFLPVSMPMQGFIATVLICSALRVRRYMYNPKPSRRLAWGEGVAAALMMTVVLSTAKWL